MAQTRHQRAECNRCYKRPEARTLTLVKAGTLKLAVCPTCLTAQDTVVRPATFQATRP